MNNINCSDIINTEIKQKRKRKQDRNKAKGEFKMVEYQNDCCGCAAPGYPCRGSDCPLRHNPHYYCDDCGEEAKLQDFDGEELCSECIEKRQGDEAE